MVTVEEASIVSPPETSAKEVTNDRDGGAAHCGHVNGSYADATVRVLAHYQHQACAGVTFCPQACCARYL